MTVLRSILIFFAAAVLNAHAQQNSPHIGYAYPAGGRQGASFQAVLGGQFLDGVTNVYFSSAGISAKIIEHTKPLTQQQFNNLRDKLRELQDRKAAANRNPRRRGETDSRNSTNRWTADDDKMVAEIRKKLVNAPNRQMTPAIAETVIVHVSIDRAVEPGEHEVRLGTQNGLSNPLAFCVGALPEFSEPAAKPAPPPGFGAAFRFNAQPQSRKAEPPTAITLPVIVNGQITPGDVDRYRFTAAKGQDVVVAVSARELIPYLPDAVPGWFQATLAVFDSNGKELAYSDDFRFHPDPVLHCRIPADGEYEIEIKDSIYRGREDFVYRIAVGELPYVTSIFPLGGKAGTKTTVQLSGWNLPVRSMTFADTNATVGVRSLLTGAGDRRSNHVPFAQDALPECSELEANNLPLSAQPVTLPVIVNGRIDKPGDVDVFRFEGRAGDEIVAEVHARRLNSPVDSVLKLTDASGRQIALNDDHDDKGAGLTTHHADSRLHVTLPANGVYFVHLSDAQHKGGTEYAYRLRISPPQPDFELRIVPSGINVRAGATLPVTIYALRKDGFSNEIALVLRDAPAGLRLSGGLVPPNQDKVRITLTAPPTPLREAVTLELEGRARIRGKQVVHAAVPAEDMMQAFAYYHLVPARELKVAVSGRGFSRNAVSIVSKMPVRIPSGGEALVQIAARSPAGQVQLELSEPPDGIVIRNVSTSADGAELVLKADASKVKPGLKGNLIVNAFANRSGPSGAQRPRANQRRIPMGSLPAIPFEIVEE